MASVHSVCCYCGTGCGLVVESAEGRIVGVAGDAAHPANGGRLCSKGSTLPLTMSHATRALAPELRMQRDAQRSRVGWDAALDHAAARFAGIIRRHGPDAVAFYVSGQLLTEEYFVFNKLARALVSTNNIDSNSRLCMSSAVSAYQRTLGADAPPCCYDDIDDAECVLIAGSNTAWAHPVVFHRILDARAAHPGRKLIVVDPRVTETAMAADLHLAIEPGTDAVLFGAMLNALVWEGLVDSAYIAAHTEGFTAMRDSIRELTPTVAARICGVESEAIVTAARWFGTMQTALSFWCQGLNQSLHGTENAAALIHLHLATGKIGRPGSGPFSLTGQPNAMGGRETGAMATLLPGHRDPGNAAEREELAALWQVASLPAAPGRTATKIIDGLADGTIKAVWIACTNPAQSLPDLARVHTALTRAEFVVLQDAFRDTETAPFADLLLPASSWGEKEGTYTNSERRISRVRAAVQPPGEARADWQIARDFALRLGVALGRDDHLRLFPWQSPADIFAEHARLTAGRDLDLSGLSYAILDARGPQQWPFPAGADAGTRRLYENQRFASASGRAAFVPLSFAGVAESTNARFPLHLNSGRMRDQWHGMSRTGIVPRLGNHAGHPFVALSAADIARRELTEGDLVRLKSRHGSIVLPVIADSGLKPGHAFVPMHWGSRRLSHGGVNALIPAIIDPVSQQPELKHAAISLERAQLPWRAVWLRHFSRPEDALALSQALTPRLSRHAYAALALSGREDALLSLSLALEAAPAAKEIEAWCALFDLSGATVLAYSDAPRGIVKRARIEDDRLAALALCGETASAAWLREAMLAGRAASELRRWLFLASSEPPLASLASRGRTICNCFDVSDQEIRKAIGRGRSTVASLQQELGCGRKCGSCLPEIAGILKSNAAPIAMGNVK